MYLSNIKRIEVEALAFAIFLHFLALLLYGIIAIRPQVQNITHSIVKLNLAGLNADNSGLEPNEDRSALPDLTEAKLPASESAPNAGSFNPTGEIFAAKPPVDIEFANIGTKIESNESPIISDVINEKDPKVARNYLELLQNTVQQKSNIPAEAAMNGISGKAILRLEFNRKGYVVKYSLKKSTGNKILDNAALEVAARLMTEPFPAPPATFYPRQKILKFDFGIDYDPTNQ
jgi:TonB family protein